MLALADRDARLLAAVMAVGLPIANVPEQTARLLLQYSVQQPQLLTPALLRGQLRQHPKLACEACQVCSRLVTL